MIMRARKYDYAKLSSTDLGNAINNVRFYGGMMDDVVEDL